MASRNTVEIILSANDRASGAIRGAFGSLDESSSRSMNFMKVGAGLAAVAFTALSGYIAKTGVDYNAMQEQSQVAWTTLLGSQEKAKNMLMDIANFAKATPFETESVDMMAKYMHNAGLEGKGLFDALMKVSDVSSAFAIPAESAVELTRQMAQVRQAGIAYTEDLNVLQDRGVPIYGAISKQLGITTADVKKMASQGKLTSDIYIKAFNSVADSVKGASDAQSQTFSGMLSTLSDSLKMISGELAKPLFDKMKQGLQAILPLLNGVLALTKGDMKGFTDTMSSAFGQEMGGKITQFATSLSNGMKTVSEWMDKGKQGIKALFDFIKGDNLGGITILTKMGLNTDTIVKIDQVFNGIRSTVLGFGKWVSSTLSALFTGKNDIGSSFEKVFNAIKSVVLPIMSDIITDVKDGVAKIKAFWDKDGAKISQAVKDAVDLIAAAFVVLAPVLKKVWDSINAVGIIAFNLLVDATTLLGNHMNIVIPILGGVVAGIAAFKIITGIIKLYELWKASTVIMTAAQWLLNVALDANPIGLVALAIGALVAAGILLYQNWDTVKNKMAVVWMEIKRAAVEAINTLSDKLNDLIGLINKIPGVKIPLIPKIDYSSVRAEPGTAPMGRGRKGGAQVAYASGTDFHPGGIALVGENGPEIVDLPRGAGVRTASETKKMLGGKGNTYHITVTGNNVDIDENRLLKVLQRVEVLYG